MRGLAGVLAPSADAAVLPEEPRTAGLRSAALLGLAAGVATLAARDTLPPPWDRLGDGLALWCLLTWWAGQRVRPVSLRWSALAGAVALVCLVVGFYGALVVLAGRSEDVLRVMAVGALALVAGPVLGAVGGLRWVRGWPAAASSALVGALVVLEPLIGVVPLVVGGLRPPDPYSQPVLPTAEDLWWCAGAAVAGLVVAATGAPRGRRLRAALLAVVVVVLCAAALAVRAAAQLGLL